jgi:2,3-bisphosphoglycerate-dependent phosphoglycerate mutase
MTDHLLTPTHYNITLLRHAESQGNYEGRHQGQADFFLTDTGRLQARLLMERWQAEKKSFDLVISSPLARARETAEIIAGAFNLPLELEPLWMERNNGMLAGLTPEEVRATLPQPGFVHPYQAVGQTGESQWELYLRAGKALQSLINHQPGAYLVVSHGGILNMLFYAILGIAPQANFLGPRFRFGNSAFATLNYNPASHRWIILGVNDHQHWKSEEG